MRRVNEKFGALTALGTMELAVGQPCPTTCPQLLTQALLQIYKSSSPKKWTILLQLNNPRYKEYLSDETMILKDLMKYFSRCLC